MECFILKKEDLHKFISYLKKRYEVIAPVQRDIIRYDVIKPNEQLQFVTPIYSVKKYFLPPKKTLSTFENNKIKSYCCDTKKRVMFLTRCDVNALIILDNMFLTHYVDHFYKACRDNSIIIEIPGKMKNSFMNSMELEDNFDIRLIPYKKDYYVEARTKKGSKLINNLFKRTNKKIKINHPREQKTLKPSDLKKSLTLTNKNNAVWNKHAKNCLSCASCTVVCPTCTCFDIDDGFDINIDIGSRQRAWASCQILEFTEVAGGHIFRKERYKRVKHRVLHKFKYHKENFGKNMCVGCGRCITACPTDIDITQIVKELK